jgi:hypothetical protein
MDDALYSVTFGAVGNMAERNGGVLTVKGGQITGGDSIYYYIGACQTVNKKVIGDARIVKHLTGGVNVFGDDAAEFTVTLEATVNDDGTVTGTMQRTDKQTPPLPFTLTHKRTI